MKTMFRALAAAGAAALLTAFSVAAPASAAGTITAPDEGALLGDGAAVILSITYECDTGQNANVFAEIAQTIDDERVATGNGFAAPVDCTGTEQSVEVSVLASGGFFAFAEGTAVARIFLATCTIGACEQVTATAELELVDD
ncbi:hypothetical protein [Arthrobacter crystallopoietes]|uniref:Uncharacterized protein n=1 Tax=Crystallibacter crystallopoietes TaxID=37928 RepID=A0A1H0ZEG1_9MICC|nr:hypothetical protein [Arthrobacter crystallopoietes]AUI52020.1 hypothetical protein AC20117_15720 [Arthrobacter crystallopoietes]SDQ25905.1 hypothetical protein SAMN04489742_0311 [Arthrobacter crystallopoietes]